MAALEAMDGDAVRHWCRLAADALTQTRAAIDMLNVFPVPDADTGTNLQLTLMSAADAAEAVPVGSPAGQVWQAAAQGALLGACGNSGVIVSELLRGLAEICGPAVRCDGKVVARALAHAAMAARAAVRRPAEGTVLTVADAAALAAAASCETLVAAVTAAAAGARAALARTQEQLDVLAASGVVDAGAAGLCVLLDALTAAVTGRVPAVYPVPPPAPPDLAPATAAGPATAAEPAVTSFGYEVTYLLTAAAQAVAALRERLDALGDSLVIVGGGELWHVHVHVPDAGAAIEEGLRAGHPRRITVTFLGAQAPAGRRVVAVAEGEGLAALLRDAGALIVRYDSGDRLTPPALMAAIRQAGTRVVVVPNGPAVAAVAAAAAALLQAEGIEVSVIPVRSAVQALAALAVHDPLRAFSADVAAMTAAAVAMRHGRIEAAEPGRVLGFAGDELVATGGRPAEMAIELADLLLAAGGELVTLVEGERPGRAGDGRPRGEPAETGLAQRVARHLREASPGIETVCYGGGPARLPLLIGVE
jgi:DAK2 domain fusion protein YloV